MTKIKCVFCNFEFEENKVLKDIKIILDNLEEVICKGKVSICPNCKVEYANGEDMILLADSFDKAYTEKYSKQ